MLVFIVVIDASYFLKGPNLYARRAYLEGSNGDLWKEVYRELDAMQNRPNFVEIESHATAITLYVAVSPPVTSWPTRWLMLRLLLPLTIGAHISRNKRSMGLLPRNALRSVSV